MGIVTDRRHQMGSTLFANECGANAQQPLSSEQGAMFYNMRAGAREVAGEEGRERQRLVRPWLVSSWLVCVMPSTPSHYCTQQQNFGALKWMTKWLVGEAGGHHVCVGQHHRAFQHGHKLRNATTPQGPRWREGGGRRQGCGGDLIVHSQPNLSPRKHMCREGNRRLCLYTPNRGRGVETGGRTAPRKNGISSDLTFCARGVGCGRRRGPERRGRAREVMRLRDVRDAAGVLFHDATLTTHRMYSGCL